VEGEMIGLATQVPFVKVHNKFRIKDSVLNGEKVTTFVNAAVVGCPENKLVNPPIFVELWLYE
jgi:hypothetical protein